MMIDIRNCPSSLLEGFDTYCPKAAVSLFDGAKVNPRLSFDIDEFQNTGEIADAMRRISVSGVQEKFPAVIRGGEIRIAADDQQSTHIIKPAPWDKTLRDRKHIPANEHLTMQIASQVYGLPTAPNGLCFTAKGAPVYITRRFDVKPDGSKLPMEDFASIIGRDEQSGGMMFKYRGSYEDVARAIRANVAAWMVDMEKFYELVIFNYIYANGDAHLKNFSLLRDGDDYRLAPAYDLLNTSLHAGDDDFALDGGLCPDMEMSDEMERTGHPCRLDFERFGDRIGLIRKRVDRVVDKYTVFPDAVRCLVNRSFLPDKLKRSYARVVNERISRFIRNSL